MLSELECLARRNKITKDLNADGCHYGELLSRTVAEIHKKLMSKAGGFETVAQLMLDLGKKNKKELGELKVMTVDAIACTSAARQTVNDMEERAARVREKFEQLQSRFSWRLFWMILGGVLGGNGLFLAAYVFIEVFTK